MGNHSHPPSDKTEKGLINMTTIFTDKNYRITFLTSRLVRFEYQENGCFEDRFTTGVQNRDFPAVKVDSNRSSRGLELDTEYLHIVYDGKVFSSNGLCISVKGNVSAYQSTWRYGEQFSTLGGTARTLDGADGEIPVENGLVSRNGFSILDDSQSMILTKDGQFIPREYIENDFYFFGYGHDYQQCLKDYYLLSGAVPLLPRYALGNWWSRFHEYSEESYLKLMERFEQENIPLSVAVIDMDWHLTDVPYGSGWTGYTWNKSLFPDPRRFLTALHNRGMHTTLNLHPAGGVEPHEEAYSAMCEALGRNPEDKQCIDFDASDEQFLREYLKYLHHPAEEDGVDFWWIDWQQGKESAVKGLDPLWVLNEKHYSDNQRKGKRGLILSRYAGPGSHRTPVGFSGDTIMSWASLAFQPEFTAMASNAGYPWWSHDIGGHMRGIRNDELSVRWLQFGVFSPIMRLHSGKMCFASKEPWTYGKEAERIMGKYLRLRHSLIPYLYSMAERTHRLGEALIRPIYYQWSEQEEAYQMRNQYLFGTSLMVCPITAPMNQEIKMGNVKVWLPEGFWYDFLTGQVYSGDRILSIWRDLESYPVFAPAGTIVPLADTLNANENPPEMTMRIFGGKSGRFDLYEDDGISLKRNAVWTHIEFDWEKGIISIKTEGNRSFLPKKRTWHIEIVGIKASQVSKEDTSLCCTYNQERNALCFSIEMFRENEEMTLSISELKLSQDNWLMRAAQRLQMAQTENDEKEMIWNLLNKKGRAPSVLGTIRATCSSSALVDCLAEVLFAQDEKEGEKK